MGVKQGTFLATLHFNIFLLAVTLLCSQRGEYDQNEPGVHLRYRCDCEAFRLQRLKARRKTKLITVCDKQYADDAAIITNSPTESHRELEVIDEKCTRLGLQMNTRKTKVLHSLIGSYGPSHTVHSI